MRKDRTLHTLCVMRLVLEEVDKHYEKGVQAKSYTVVWKKYIFPKFGISLRTMMRYIGDRKLLNEDRYNTLS